MRPVKGKKKLKIKNVAIVAIAVIFALAFLQSRHPGTGSKKGGASSASVAGNSQGNAMKTRLNARLDKQFSQDNGNVIPCTPASLYADYDANEVAADAKYNGKWVQLDGRINSVNKDLTGDPVLVFSADAYGVAQIHADLFDVQIKDIVGDNDFTTCTAAEKAATFRKGQRVIVEGLGSGAVLGMPRLEQCVVLDPSMVGK